MKYRRDDVTPIRPLPVSWQRPPQPRPGRAGISAACILVGVCMFAVYMATTVGYYGINAGLAILLYVLAAVSAFTCVVSFSGD